MHPPFRLLSLAATVLLLAACSTSAPIFSRTAPPLAQAAAELRQARRAALPAETRAACYLDAAARASTSTADPKAQAIYNDAAGELTALLRSADDGRLWNRPLALTAHSTTYRLRFQPGTRDGVWSPDDFTAFTPAHEIRRRHLRRSVTESGLGSTPEALSASHVWPHQSTFGGSIWFCRASSANFSAASRFATSVSRYVVNRSTGSS